MSNIHGNITLQKIPILRLLLSVITGVLVEYCYNVPLLYFAITAIFSLLLFTLLNFLTATLKMLLKPFIGICLIIFFISIGGILCFEKNEIHDKEWIGNYYKTDYPVMVTLQEPLIVRAKSYKALAKAEAVLINNQWQPVKGNVLLYFLKDTTKPVLTYGTQLIVTDHLTEIENANNPGGFNYREYCLFQHIYYQSFLKVSTYKVLNTTSTTYLGSLIIKTRIAILNILHKNISNAEELSVAEALLIGFRDDLDKDLLQAYNNTGVIHIIIISGLRMGMIYSMLIFLFSPFKNRKWTLFVKPIVILLILWGFCLIAGAAASATRSTVMFSFILLGESINRRTNIYNNLALSALIVLFINPFSLWDAGFQLSYAAVLSILIFYKHIHNWCYFKNKLLGFVWSLSAVTISAQILTLPLILFHFHQLPTLFLFTNVLAVPFSCVILYAELLLVIISPLPFVANLMGQFVGWMLGIMNTFISNVNSLSFSVWGNIHVSIPQVLLLYGFIIGIAGWLFYKKQQWFLSGLLFFLIFSGYNAIDFIIKSMQQKLIVYNISQHSAIDIIDGTSYIFVGDNALKEENFLSNFHLKPARILNRTSIANTLSDVLFNQNIIKSKNKTILIINQSIANYTVPEQKLQFDAIILTNNPNIHIKDLTALFICNLYVFDASSPTYKIKNWVSDAVAERLNYFSVIEKGAFEIEL